MIHTVENKRRLEGCLKGDLKVVCWPSAADEEWYSPKRPSSTVAIQHSSGRQVQRWVAFYLLDQHPCDVKWHVMVTKTILNRSLHYIIGLVLRSATSSLKHSGYSLRLLSIMNKCYWILLIQSLGCTSETKAILCLVNQGTRSATILVTNGM